MISPTSTGRYDHHTSPLMSTPASHVAGADGTHASAPWHPVNRVLFRFGLVYFCLWAPGYFVSPLFAGLFGDAPTAYEGACGAMVDLGRATFRNLMDPIRDPNNLGCAGTTEAMLVMIVVAAFVAAIWSALDRRRRAYPRLSRLLIGACGYYLAAVLFTYGIMKLIPQQFPIPGADRLLTAFGEQGRVDVLWGLIGSSPAYTMFTGAMETSAAFLLFFRRTRTLGALLATGTMLNVTVLNFDYSVGVKLLSGHLLALALILVLVDWRRIANVFWLGRPVNALTQSTSRPRAIKVSMQVVKAVLLGTWVIYLTSQTWMLYRWLHREIDAPLHGLYDVTSFVIDGGERPPLITDSTRWQNVVIGTPPLSAIRMMNDGWVDDAVTVDADAGVLTVGPWVMPEIVDLGRLPTPTQDPIGRLMYEVRPDGELFLRGTVRDRPAEITLRERRSQDFPLLGRSDRDEDHGEFNFLFLLGLLIPTAAIGWTLIDRRRPSGSLVGEIVTSVTAFYVGIAVCAYGFAKIFLAEFPFPTIQALLTEFGQLSPAQALRNAMGVSPAYTMFIGWTEVIAGTLLCFRRTRTLGALAAIAVLGHTVIVTYEYDLPLLAFSSHLLLMALLLAVFDARRLFDAFVRSRAVPGVDARSPITERLGQRRALVGTVVITAMALAVLIGVSANRYQQQVTDQHDTPLGGLYDVQSFVLDGRELPPLATDTTRWQSLIIETPGEAVVQMMNDEFVHFDLVSHTDDRAITIAAFGDHAVTRFGYHRPADDLLLLRGNWAGREAEIRMKRRDLDEFFLVRQRFEWIETDYSIFWQPHLRR